MKKVPLTPATELKVNNIQGFYIRKVKPFGTSAKVDCPKEHLGKTVYLVILNNDKLEFKARVREFAKKMDIEVKALA
ncbi:MAG: DUF2080 family transposase-associated protein, partial [Methanosarcinales archaeon]|nr:DUF2080 family transposase-associated protein [Methanosarcinales archaeon]